MATCSQYSHLKKSHGQRSLEGYSPQGREESDMTQHACVSVHMCHLFPFETHISSHALRLRFQRELLFFFFFITLKSSTD